MGDLENFTKAKDNQEITTQDLYEIVTGTGLSDYDPMKNFDLLSDEDDFMNNYF